MVAAGIWATGNADAEMTEDGIGGELARESLGDFHGGGAGACDGGEADA